jgi:hypothetical protein
LPHGENPAGHLPAHTTVRHSAGYPKNRVAGDSVCRTPKCGKQYYYMEGNAMISDKRMLIRLRLRVRAFVRAGFPDNSNHFPKRSQEHCWFIFEWCRIKADLKLLPDANRGIEIA